jgi:methanogen homocitrate synthase
MPEVCDVTLREGEQTPGVAFSEEEKIKIAGLLDGVGVEVIEAGFPSVSQDERRAIKKIVSLGLSAEISCLSRHLRKDIDLAIDCGVDVIGLVASTSELHARYKYRKPKKEIMDSAIEVLDYAKSHGLKVRFAAEDSSRADKKFLLRYFKEGEKHGADLVSVADTVGLFYPSKFFNLIKELKKNLKVGICVHCHDDLGLALANTLAALDAGAEQLQATVNGLGERAGNTPLEELLVALKIHHGIEKYELKILKKLSRTVEKYSGVRVAKNKPVVGKNVFLHESGIHVAAIIKNPSTYEPFPPEMVGARRGFVLGKHSGRKALEHLVGNLRKEEMDFLLKKIKSISSRKKISRKDIKVILSK